MAGLEGRTDMLVRLGSALQDKPDYFGDDGRPGELIGESAQTICSFAVC